MLRNLLNTLLLAAGLLLGTLAPASAEAKNGFKAGNLFMGWGTGEFAVAEYDPAFRQTRVFAQNHVSAPRGLAFGPGGLLYVSSWNQDRVKILNPDGLQVGEIGAGSGLDGPEELAFGANGHLYVISGNSNEVFQFDRQGDFVRSFGAAAGLLNPAGLAIGSRGRIYVGGYDYRRIYVFEANGEYVREFSTWSQIGSLASAPNGNLLVSRAEDDDLFEMTTEGQIVRQFGDDIGLDFPRYIAVGPDSRIYVSSANSKELFVLSWDGEVEEIHEDILWIGSIAFAPQRFRVALKGALARPGGNVTRVRETDAVLTHAPGTPHAFLELSDDVADPFDLASTLGTDTVVLRGHEAQTGNGKSRLFQGIQLDNDGGTADLFSAAFDAKGKLDRRQRFTLRSAKGSLTGEVGGAILNIPFRTGKELR